MLSLRCSITSLSGLNKLLGTGVTCEFRCSVPLLRACRVFSTCFYGRSVMSSSDKFGVSFNIRYNLMFTELLLLLERSGLNACMLHRQI